jgi:hypothetical protein
LNPSNRWVILSKLLPWDELCSIYWKYVPEKSTGRTPLNPRIVLGAIIIKHLCDLDDRETVEQIKENPYLQYFLGMSAYSNVAPFEPSMLVHFRKRISKSLINKVNKKW